MSPVSELVQELRDARADVATLRTELSAVQATFSTWRETRCHDAQMRISALEGTQQRIGTQLAKYAGGLGLLVILFNVAIYLWPKG